MFQSPQKLWISVMVSFTTILYWSKNGEAMSQLDNSDQETTPIPLTDVYIPSKRKQHNAVLIFLHESDENGSDLKKSLQSLIGTGKFHHVKMIFPTAPSQPYTLFLGRERNVWYDQNSVTFDAEEKLDSFKAGEQVIREVIDNETCTGIPPNRIIIGGFSMGGVMALHYGYRLSSGLAGVFALSAFLPEKTIMYDTIKKSNQSHQPRLFMATGESDNFVMEKWCKHTFEKFEECGVEGEYHSIGELKHAMDVEEILRLWYWVDKTLPDGLEYDVKNNTETQSK